MASFWIQNKTHFLPTAIWQNRVLATLSGNLEGLNGFTLNMPYVQPGISAAARSVVFTICLLILVWISVMKSLTLSLSRTVLLHKWPPSHSSRLDDEFARGALCFWYRLQTDLRWMLGTYWLRSMALTLIYHI